MAGNIFEIKHSSLSKYGFYQQNLFDAVDDTTYTTKIDTKDFEGLLFLLATHSISGVDTTVTATLVHNDDGATSTSTWDAVSDEETLDVGSADFILGEDEVCKSIAYIGKRRYVALKAVGAGTSTPVALVACEALLTQAHHQPTED